MTDTLFTPGPWRVGYADGSGGGNPDDYNEYFMITSVETDEQVVSGASGESGDMRSWCVGIEDEHDATLISAAPDMYAALEQLLEGIDLLAKHGRILQPDHPACEYARHTIRKARGET